MLMSISREYFSHGPKSPRVCTTLDPGRTYIYVRVVCAGSMRMQAWAQFLALADHW